ncbi:2-amino-4-hydroxy-6-hydroxymethyldihydropteridine diphosphokinase [Halochromatium sp.]
MRVRVNWEHVPVMAAAEGHPIDAAGSVRRCWISLGSNLERETSIRGGIQGLRQAFGALILSPVYETEAEGFDGQPFLNLVAGIETALKVGEIRAVLRRIEAEHGRERGGERFAPRTLDLDLLTYGDCAGEIDGYLIPRDEILRYAFVLCPLADVAPDERHPTDGRRYAELWRQLLARLRDERSAQPRVILPRAPLSETASDWLPLRRYALDLSEP